MMEDLKVVTKLVEHILATDERARNSDSFLYLRVLTAIGNQKNIDIDSMSITTFLLNLRDYGFPPFESVRRARQKLQAKHPELAASNRICDCRMERERTFRGFARGEV